MLLHKNEQRHVIFAFLLLAVYLSPLFILGENAHIRVHDNLDSNIAWYKVLAKSGQLAGGLEAAIPQIINGLPRNAFGSELTGIVWLYALFSPMIAYSLSQAISRVVAFIGMYLLLKDHFIQKKEMTAIRVWPALAFALTPFWPSGMLSTLGMPLALWAFLHIRQGNYSWKTYLALTLLPFYSSIVLGFFFFLTAMGIFWVTDALRGKGWNLKFLISIIYMGIVFLIVEYRLVYSLLFATDPTSRDEYFHARLTLASAIRLTFKNFILGHTHVMTVHGLFILLTLIFALYAIVKKGLWRSEKTFFFLFVLNFLLSAWYAFWFYKGWLPLTERFHILDTFNFARFHFLRPLVIYASFALALKILWEQMIGRKQLVIFFLAAQIIVLFAFNDEIIYRNKPTVQEFYAEDLFTEVKEHIGLPQRDYRVASIGIHPAIAQYNGFYTLDTYNNFYPLSYKYKFRKIIEQELAKNKTIRTYFDEWGGRCYIFTDELGKHYMIKKNSRKKLKHLQLNTEPFKQLGGSYFLAALPIENAGENNLSLEKIFTSKTAAWKIYLYKAL
ncbi:hypothetical protein CVD28_11320 [Bacillus sp. M6-12]|uniref:DUF6044 family protein n=1 Tax=Bacillus sp. M6-12 TaxID=2054166 RepID=UPI000C75877E|nr:DUF6044 family protein [Bacillus sp. M6-12]PLS17579.1 hypothetical protein CVD28_11320 [Bacillus sp. M6-12]